MAGFTPIDFYIWRSVVQFIESCGVTLPFYEMLPVFERNYIGQWAPIDHWFAHGECDAGKRPSIPVHVVTAEIFDHKVARRLAAKHGLDIRNPDHIGPLRKAAIRKHEMLVAGGAVIEIDGQPVRHGIQGTLVGVHYLALNESKIYKNYDAMLPLHVRHAPPGEIIAGPNLVIVARTEFTTLGQRRGQGLEINTVVDGGWHRLLGRADIDTNGARNDVCHWGHQVSQCVPVAVEPKSRFPHLQTAFMRAAA